MYQGIADRNFARACWAQPPSYYAERPPSPRFPLALRPSPWGSAPRWLQRSMARVARRWLRERGDAGRALAARRIEVNLTEDGRVSVHLHTYSRKAQRRATSLAEALARRLAKTLRASADGPERGWWTVVVSWGYDPQDIGEPEMLAFVREIGARHARLSA